VDVPDAWIKVALEITGRFENSADPFGGVSGDFDQMGISLGVLQWNLGMGSLQPLVKAIGRGQVLSLMPIYGHELWTACTGDIASALAIARRWQTGSKLRPDVRLELKNLARSPAFLDQQIAAAGEVGQRALDRAAAWTAGTPALQEFCWFFDLLTQNGGLKDVSPAMVADFIAASGHQQADDVVCDWLESRPPTDHGVRDAWKNAALWRNQVPTGNLTLFVASYLRAQRAKPEWRTDTLNRKATIAVGHGWVHTSQHFLTDIFDSAEAVS
jgi:hypothetical protein